MVAGPLPTGNRKPATRHKVVASPVVSLQRQEAKSPTIPLVFASHWTGLTSVPEVGAGAYAGHPGDVKMPLHCCRGIDQAAITRMSVTALRRSIRSIA